MLADLKQFLYRHALSDKTLVVAVSGGVDSMVLLDLLARCHPHDKLFVAHLNHQLRGADAAQDAAFVAAAAKRLGLACESGSADVPALVRQHGYTVEEAARRARYRFLAAVAAKFEASAVVTAHHADDQAETVLMNVLRGSGLTGLRGMLPSSSVPYATGNLRLVRPLLERERAEIERYAVQNSVNFRVDTSNVDVSLLRNRVRRELLPTLAAVSPQVRQHLRQLALLATADDALLAQLADDAWGEISAETPADKTTQLAVFELERWRMLPLSLRRRTLRRATAHLETGFITLEQARTVAETGTTGQVAALTAGWRLRVGYQQLFIERADAPVLPDVPQVPAGARLALAVPGSVSLGKWRISAEMVLFDRLMLSNQDVWQAFVMLAPRDRLHVRGREPGEVMAPLGMGGRRKKIKDVMIDNKLPAGVRAHWPIVASGDRAVWVVGQAVDEGSQISAEANEVIRLSCQPIA